MTEVEAQELAAWMFDHWIRRHRDNPSEQSFWRIDLYDRLWKPAVRSDTAWASGMGVVLDSPDDLAARALERWCLDEADTLIIVKDLVIDEPSRLKLGKALAAAVQRASQRPRTTTRVSRAVPRLPRRRQHRRSALPFQRRQCRSIAGRRRSGLLRRRS